MVVPVSRHAAACATLQTSVKLVLTPWSRRKRLAAAIPHSLAGICGIRHCLKLAESALSRTDTTTRSASMSCFSTNSLTSLKACSTTLLGSSQSTGLTCVKWYLVPPQPMMFAPVSTN